MKKTKSHVLAFMLLVLFGCTSASEDIQQRAEAIAQQQAEQPSRGEWTAGGNLHAATALEWQKASYQNKRATVADYLFAMAQRRWLDIPDLSEPVQGEQIRPYAEAIVAAVDQRFAKRGNEEQNQSHFKHKRVRDAIITVAQDYGWYYKPR